MNNLNKDIQEAIEKNLSGEVGESLKAVLIQAEEDANRVEYLLRQYEDQAVEIGKRDARIVEYVALGRDANDLFEQKMQMSVDEAVLKARTEERNRFMDYYTVMWSQVFATPDVQDKLLSLSGSFNGFGPGGSVNGTMNLDASERK